MTPEQEYTQIHNYRPITLPTKGEVWKKDTSRIPVVRESTSVPSTRKYSKLSRINRGLVLKIVAIIFILSVELVAFVFDAVPGVDSLLLHLAKPAPTQVECVHVTVAFNSTYTQHFTQYDYTCPTKQGPAGIP